MWSCMATGVSCLVNLSEIGCSNLAISEGVMPCIYKNAKTAIYACPKDNVAQ